MRNSANPGEFATAHGVVATRRHVVLSGEVIHSVRDIKKQFLGNAPSGTTRRGGNRPRNVYVQFAIDSGLLAWHWIVALRYDVSRPLRSVYRDMDLGGLRVILQNKIHLAEDKA